MRRFAFVAAVVGALPGCFYFDSINQRPSVLIENTDANPTFRGDAVNLAAVAHDPEGDPMRFVWNAWACTDASDLATCDVAPFATGGMDTFSFDVPNLRVDAPLSNESVLVTLRAIDRYNATSRPDAELIIPIVDRVPIVLGDKFGDYELVPGQFVVGTPIKIFAKVTDDDDPPARLQIEWDPSEPTGTMFDYDLVDHDPAVLVDPATPSTVQYGKVFTPHGEGEWTVEITATDPLGNTDSDLVTINVVGDHAPCLRQLAPAVPPAGVAMPLSSPTLFRVPRVEDDLDPYPLIPNDPIFRATTFQWSLKRPGQSAHAIVAGATGNTLALDPASYAPGDLVEVRVQIYDREATPLPCNDGEATCSTISDNACLQRQTWRVEIR